jgi:hypothetical protein
MLIHSSLLRPEALRAMNIFPRLEGLGFEPFPLQASVSQMLPLIQAYTMHANDKMASTSILSGRFPVCAIFP